MASDELKPCAHCGEVPAGPAKLGGNDERCGYNFTMTIGCRCGVSVSRKSHENKLGWCDDTGQAALSVVEAWNRRAQDFDAMRQRAEKAEIALAEVRSMFPLKLDKQAFVVNGGAPLRADGDDVFYSAAKVNHVLAKLVERIDAALAKQPS